MEKRTAPRTATLTLTNVPARLVADLDEWARLRRTTREKAAQELIRLGLEITSEKVQKEAREALATMDRIKAAHDRL